MNNKANALNSLFDWTVNNLRQFDLTETSDINRMLGGLKPLGELVLTMEILRRSKIREADCCEIVSHAWSQVENGNLILSTLAARPDLIVLSGLYANFKEFGYVNKRLDNIIFHLIRTRSCNSIEFPYWRRLDVMHASSSLGIEAFPSIADEKCWFYSNPEPWMISDDIAYAITHDVFYLTDFGRNSSRLSLSSLNYISTWLPSWLKLFELRKNWDIYSELLMVSASIGQVNNIKSCIEILISTQEDDGLIPSPSGAGKQLLDFEETPDFARKRFLSNYHTCLVACMALAMTK